MNRTQSKQSRWLKQRIKEWVAAVYSQARAALPPALAIVMLCHASRTRRRPLTHQSYAQTPPKQESYNFYNPNRQMCALLKAVHAQGRAIALQVQIWQGRADDSGHGGVVCPDGPMEG